MSGTHAFNTVAKFFTDRSTFSLNFPGIHLRPCRNLSEQSLTNKDLNEVMITILPKKVMGFLV